MFASRSSFVVVVASSALTLFAIGCSGGDDPQPTSTTSPTQPSGTTGAEDGKGTADKASVGPECKAYLACCDEIAAKYPSAAASCSTVKEQLEKAKDKAQSDAVESSCKSAIASMKSGGMCK